jgi:hypothetical protein
MNASSHFNDIDPQWHLPFGTPNAVAEMQGHRHVLVIPWS